MPEHFQCRNCSHVGPLDLHGSCEDCGCELVVSVELLSLMTMARVSVDYPPLESNQVLGRVGQA